MRFHNRILMISSRPPEHFGYLGANIITGFEQLGWQVEYLTRYKSEDKHVLGIYKSPKKSSFLLKKLIKRLLGFVSLSRLYNQLSKISKKNPNYITRNGRTIVSKDEMRPIISIDEILKNITNQYDFVFVHCWQDMITSVTLRAIYNHLKVPIIISAYDFQPFTGGCFYFGNCRNYEHSCGACPILNSNDINDQTNINFNIKKDVYSTIPIGAIANPYSRYIIEKTGLFDKNNIETAYYPIDEELFCPLDVNECRKHFGISDKYKFIIFARFAGLQHISKGYKYMLKSVNEFVDNLSAERKGAVLLLLAGTKDLTYEKEFHIDVMNVGLLNTNDLIKAYSAANVFLSTSIDDAGPSMVDQSVLCGTPVVSFDIGSAQYMVDNGKTGYKTRLKDTQEMAVSLQKLYNQDKLEQEQIRKNCRRKGLETSSLSLFCNTIIKLSVKLESSIIYKV